LRERRRAFPPPRLKSAPGIGCTPAIAVKAFCYVLALAMHAHQQRDLLGHSCLSKVVSENGFRSVGEPLLASICESPRQSVDQIRRRSASRPENKQARLHCLERSVLKGAQRAQNRQSGLCRFSRIYIALCKLTYKSAQISLYRLTQFCQSFRRRFSTERPPISPVPQPSPDNHNQFLRMNFFDT
jgi:hypothetical protein